MPEQDMPAIPDELIDQLLADRPLTAGAITGPEGLLQELTKRLVERAMAAELDEHLAYEHGSPPPPEQSNRRNGSTPKTLVTEHGAVRIEAPRDREGSFEPQIVPKGERRFEGFDDKIIALYAGGMSTREIERHLAQLYGVAVGRDLISRVTDAVLDDVREWQARPLEPLYLILYLDAIVVKIRDQGTVQNRHAYLAIGVDEQGHKDVLGLWIARSEGAKFWLSVVSELKHRGVQDVLICCVDGLKGFPEAIEAVWPQATVQTCLVHLVRNSLRFVSYRDRKPLAAALRRIYSTPTEDAARLELDRFAATWDARYPMISRAWNEHWERICPFLAFPPALRRAVYTTNAIEALNSTLRKAVRTRGHFPTEDAARKLLYLAILRVQEAWKRPAYEWTPCLAAFSIHFPDRITL